MQDVMQAMVLDAFGGAERMHLGRLPIPELGPDDVLIRVEVAGVGEWDPFEREGGFAELLEARPHFPYVLGSEGAGTVAAVGPEVERFRVGDRVYAVGFPNPRGGFYAEYAVVPAGLVAPVPAGLPIEQAATVGGVGLTALRGLEDTLHLARGERLAIVGASGGVGHVAVQLARRMGARVLAVASGDDGVALCRRLGAEASVDGHRGDVTAALAAFASDGLDAALLTAGGAVAETVLDGLRERGRAAYPHGVEPEPASRKNLVAYDGAPDPEILVRLNRWIGAGPFEVRVARTFPLRDAARAHHALEEHHVGKMALRVAS